VGHRPGRRGPGGPLRWRARRRQNHSVSIDAVMSRAKAVACHAAPPWDNSLQTMKSQASIGQRVTVTTLTGAARVALGVELPALFTNDDALAASLQALGQAESDPLWRLPLWPPYRRHVESKVADLTNAPETGFAGAITAALFLEAFTSTAASWAHVDLMAWNTEPRPGRPKGGEAMAMRAAYAYIREKFVP